MNEVEMNDNSGMTMRSGVAMGCASCAGFAMHKGPAARGP